MSSSAANTAAVRACFESASQGDFDALDGILTPDYVLHPDEVRGADGLKERVQIFREALSGLKVTVDQQFADGDYVTTRYTITGTHEGDLMGTPPSGKHVAFSGITISRCEDGRVAEEWELVDTVALLGQIGALPAMTLA